MMQQLSMDYSMPPIQESDISRIERLFNITLPQDYRQFLLRYNGGRPEPSVFRIKNYYNSDNMAVIDTFLGISNGQEDSLEEYIKTYRDRMPKNIIPIAYDPGGNIIAISVSGNDQGYIYFWEHESEADEGDTPSYDNLYLIDENMTSFINGLTQG